MKKGDMIKSPGGQIAIVTGDPYTKRFMEEQDWETLTRGKEQPPMQQMKQLWYNKGKETKWEHTHKSELDIVMDQSTERMFTTMDTQTT